MIFKLEAYITLPRESLTITSKKYNSSPDFNCSLIFSIHSRGRGEAVNLSETILLDGVTLPVASSSVTIFFL
jgi:hypothetical protein